MGVAVGLAFAFLVTHITAFGIATLINYSPTPDVVMLMFVGTCAITFGIGATLTGSAITLTEDTDTAEREFGDDVKAPSPERYFWVRNAPYSLNDPDNLLKLQQMRPPSERTINPHLEI